jgi:hypothetical protein
VFFFNDITPKIQSHHGLFYTLLGIMIGQVILPPRTYLWLAHFEPASARPTTVEISVRARALTSLRARIQHMLQAEIMLGSYLKKTLKNSVISTIKQAVFFALSCLK